MQPLTNKRIFYVEADVKSRAIVQIILERSGSSLYFERWVQKDIMLRLTASMPIDLILLDLMFPNHVTGYDIFDIIRGDERFTHIPIVAISAADPSIEIPKAQMKGFSGFISKPINLWTFPQMIDTCLRGESIWER